MSLTKYQRDKLLHIIEKLISWDICAPFRELVDPIRDGATDYYTITYDLQGGDGDVTPVYIDKTVIQNNDIGLPYYTVTYSEGVFDGWSKKSTGPFDGLVDYRPESAVMRGTLTDNMNLYAIYKKGAENNEGGNQLKYANKILWTKGITPFPDNRWVERGAMFPGKYTIPWKKSEDQNKWWDAKKRVPTYGGYDSNMCWAATASNALHWWSYHNSDYIAKYFDLHPNYTQPKTGFPNVKDSEIFQDFKDHWKNEGGVCDDAVVWWLTGYAPNKDVKPGGGYFKDVFEGAANSIVTTTRSLTLTRKRFNEFITQALEQGKFLTWYTDSLGPHATTIYGARYDADGWIRTIFEVDNNHGVDYETVTGEITSIIYFPIIYFDQGLHLPQEGLETNPEFQKNPVAWIQAMNPNMGVRISQLQSYDLRRDVWEKYFAEQESKAKSK